MVMQIQLMNSLSNQLNGSTSMVMVLEMKSMDLRVIPVSPSQAHHRKTVSAVLILMVMVGRIQIWIGPLL